LEIKPLPGLQEYHVSSKGNVGAAAWFQEPVTTGGLKKWRAPVQYPPDRTP
jgi:hypothetical protein